MLIKHIYKALTALWLLVLTTAGFAQSTPQSHRDLDWNAPRRWVHIDNILPERVELFESARLEWLTALRVGDSLLGDGRPLFWQAKSDSVTTYFTLYPFREMSDLDARVKMLTATNSVIGKEPGERYDRGDSGLVSPHCTQIWRRSADDDIVWAGTETLTELTANVGRLDVHMIDLQHSGEVDSLWGEIKRALIAHEYPLACRAYGTVYGSGENMMLWLAPDSVTLQRVPSVESVLGEEFGDEKGRVLFAEFRQFFPIQRSYDVRRRPDLSNLGR